MQALKKKVQERQKRKESEIRLCACPLQEEGGKTSHGGNCLEAAGESAGGSGNNGRIGSRGGDAGGDDRGLARRNTSSGNRLSGRGIVRLAGRSVFAS